MNQIQQDPTRIAAAHYEYLQPNNQKQVNAVTKLD